VIYPDMLTVECVDAGDSQYLEVRLTGQDSARTDIGGDLSPAQGLHLVDVKVAGGDLVDLVATQSAAWDG
jgi:hypothetical protein